MPNKRKDYPQAIPMYMMGMSVGDVAAYYGITRQAMWMWFNRRNVAMRSNLKYARKNHFYRSGTRSDKRAQHLVEKAIRKGIMVRPDRCEACDGVTVFKNGRYGLEAHHDDYNKPLVVRWLCKRCHHQWHEKNKAVPVSK